MTWDKTKPAGGLAPSVGDDAIRANNEALELGLGAEHDFPGSATPGPRRHKFPRGDLAARSALTGMVAGSIFIRSDLMQIDVYDGAAWVAYGAAPAGGIIMWSGSPSAIPAGWALCDGTAGTPDLRGRFIVGYESRTGGSIPAHSDADYNAIGNTTYGEKAHALTTAELASHAHPITDVQHSHTLTSKLGGSGTTLGDAGAPHAIGAGSTDPAYTGLTTTDAAGSGTAHENRPPYYVLAFIMKL